ncbi:hypothetical protein DITRI_Ditri01bG0157400 [Diplodiscus trichospermus]
MEVTDSKWTHVQAWAEQIQEKHGDCHQEGFVSTLPDKVNLDLRQNDVSELFQMWRSMNFGRREAFIKKYGMIASLLSVEIDAGLIRAALPHWDPSYRCYTFNGWDFTPTIEEYATLLQLESQQMNRVYVKRSKAPSAKKVLSGVLKVKVDRLEHHFRDKNGLDCLTQEFLCDFIREHLEEEVGSDALALALYGLVLFPRVLGYVDPHVIDFFDRIQHQTYHVPAILAETIRSLNHCRSEGGRFHGCAPLLYIWLRSHVEKNQTKFSSSHLPRDPILEFCKGKWTERARLIKDSPLSQVQQQDPVPIESLVPPVSEVELIRQEMEDRGKEWERKVNLFERQIQDLQYEIDARDGRLSKAEAERDRYLSYYNDFKRDWENLKAGALQRSLEETRKDLKVERAKVQQLERKIKHNQESMLAVEQRCALSESQIRRMEEERTRTSSKKEHDQLKAQMMMLESENAWLMKEKDGVEDRDALKNEVEALKREKDAWEAQEETYQQDLFVLAVENRTLGQSVQRFGDTIRRYRAQARFCVAKLRDAAMLSMHALTEVRELARVTTPVGRHGQQLVRILRRAQRHYRRVTRFFRSQDRLTM